MPRFESTKLQINSPTRSTYTIDSAPFSGIPLSRSHRGGDIAAVSYRGRVAYAIYGDRGPRTKIGEGSIALARALGIPSDPVRGGTQGGVTYIVFPGSGTGRGLDQAEIDRRGAELLRRSLGAR